jgi:hypothetical protein
VSCKLPAHNYHHPSRDIILRLRAAAVCFSSLSFTRAAFPIRFLPYSEECPPEHKGAIALMLPPVTVELHETAYKASGSTQYTLSVIFSTAAIMAVKGAQLVYAANNQPLPYEDTWFYGGCWALLPPYSDWEVNPPPVSPSRVPSLYSMIYQPR